MEKRKKRHISSTLSLFSTHKGTTKNKHPRSLPAFSQNTLRAKSKKTKLIRKKKSEGNATPSLVKHFGVRVSRAQPRFQGFDVRQ